MSHDGKPHHGHESHGHHAGPPPPAVVMQLLTAKFHSRTMSELARVGVFDHLSATSPKRASDLAAALGVNEDALYRMMRSLTLTPLLTETEDHQFLLTPVGEVLQEKNPHSMKGMAVYIGAAWHNMWWSELGHTLKTGESSATKACGKNVFEWMHDHPVELAEFQGAMTSMSRASAPAVAEAFDFSPYKVICDVGGGHGELLSAILDKSPQSEGILFDLPEVVAASVAIIQTHSAAARVKKVGGDMFASVPSGVDLFIMKHIVHDWSDKHCIAILQNMLKSLNANGRVITVEHVVKKPMEFDPAKVLDVEMLAATEGGRERTESEFNHLYQQAGLKVVAIIPTKSPVSLIVGVPA